ncbi:hypothetical protein JCM19037_848 [Geomicrobium sp. JCM 19037]|uniref:hypothetical protein n=1 Tax=unclassified Geomicrobium TaxID=2628951 RepID=UPI00045F49BC|nr:hypothetical protein [Geomicrobium sp. JCM 19037]GAK02603.1 hypothetical protein JCM19037_848 [Geomicrobium sp. JCM 19037]
MNAGLNQQIQFLNNYREYVDTVVDGLQLAVQFFREEQYPSGERLLQDFMVGFERFGEDNMTMYALFGADERLAGEWRTFQEECENVRQMLATDNKKKWSEVITQQTIPVFQRWKLTVDQLIQEKQGK